MYLKKIIKDNLSLIFLFSLTIFIIWPIFLPGYFSHHDDLQVMRIFEMRKCFADFQIPCRWVPDMGFGNGYPLFNYYNVLPYYIGGLASLILGFIGSAKLLFLIALILATFSMYLFVKEWLGIYPALLASVLYTFAPYRALDIFVRGAISESFAIAIVPLIFYFGLRLTRENKIKSRLGLSLSFAAFLTSHNVMTLLFSPVIVLFFIIWYFKRNLVLVRSVLLSLLLGFGLSAFFMIPAFLERNLVQIENLVKADFNFRAHFVTLYQLFLDRSWGYGASSSGIGDTISFQIGWPHVIIAGFFPLVLILLNKKNIKTVVLSIVIFLIFVLSIFMTHNKSAFIWEGIGILRFAQFPWRFLSLSIFTSSLLGGLLVYSLRDLFAKMATIILIVITVYLNWGYFKPNIFFLNLSDREKLSGQLWQEQQRASIFDYLPIGAIEPKEPASNKPMIDSGNTEVLYFKEKSNSWEGKFNVKSESLIELPIYDFPNWKVYEENKEVQHTSSDYLGRIVFKLKPGQHSLSGKLTDTNVRVVSNWITILSGALIVYIFYHEKNRKNIR